MAKPNPAHYALGLLAHPPVLARIAPCHSLSRPSSIRHITQNIDALALRVIESLPSDANMSSESSRVEEAIIEMHGDISVTRCISCQHINRSYEPQLASTLAHLELQSQPSMKPDGIITVDQLPKCGGDTWAGSNRYGRCGGLLRPEVVWFGEVPPQSGEIARMMSTCDMLLVVGSSSIVRKNFHETLKADLKFQFLTGSSGSGLCCTGEEKWWNCSCIQSGPFERGGGSGFRVYRSL